MLFSIRLSMPRWIPMAIKPNPPAPPLGGLTRFVIQDRLGAGGFGTVYRSFDLERGTTVALKTLHHLDARSLLGFKREFRALADISHPNLITLYELISDDEQCFFTMELVDGLNFREYVQEPDRLRTALSATRAGPGCFACRRKVAPRSEAVQRAGDGSRALVILDFGLVTNATAWMLRSERRQRNARVHVSGAARRLGLVGSQ